MDPWILGKEIGSGGSGVVRAATHRSDGRSAAIKRVPRSGLAESAIIARLDHPHVVQIYDSGVDAEGAWIAMERAKGVAQALDTDGLLRLLDELLSGLSAAHAAGVLHLDVKPGNLLERSDGSAVLADFGLARGPDGDRLQRGTPGYMAPEAFDGRPERLTPATDLYGVGCLATAWVSGTPPFRTTDWDAAAAAHRLEPVPPLVPRIPVPPGLAEWVRRLLSKAPAARFPTAAAARTALNRLGQTTVRVGHATPFSAALTATIAKTRAGKAVPIAALQAPGSVAEVELPESWPAKSARDPRNSGAGLLDLLEPPFTGRDEPCAELWRHLGRPGRIAIRGPSGSGRTRLGHAFARAASQSGVLVLEGTHVGALRQLLWLPEHTRGAALEEALSLRVPQRVLPTLVAVLEGRSGIADALACIEALSSLAPLVWAQDEAFDAPNSLVVGVDLPNPTHTVELPLFDTAFCRQVLTRWVGLRPAVVSEVAETAGGSIGLAVRTVRQGVRDGCLQRGPRGLELREDDALELDRESVARHAPNPHLLEAAVRGLIQPADTEAARLLLASGLGTIEGEVVRWISAAAREAVLQAEPDARRQVHLEVARGFDSPDYAAQWERGRHLLEGGDVDGASHLLLEAATDMSGSGKMVAVGRVLSQLERAFEGSVPTTDFRWGLLLRSFAQLGPTHLGVARCRAYSEYCLELADAAPDTEDWQYVRRSTLGGLAWLSNVQRLPHVARQYIEMANSDACSYTNSLAYATLYTGDARGALALFQRAQAQAKDTGNRYMEVISDACAQIPHRWLGHDVQERWTTLRARLDDDDYHSADGDLALARSDFHRWRGELDEAERYARRALDLSAQGEARAGPAFEVGFALTRLERGHAQAATRRLEACLRNLDGLGPAWEALVSLHHQSARAAAGWEVDLLALQQVEVDLQSSGYTDPDLWRSAERLVRHGCTAAQPLRDRLAATLIGHGAVLVAPPG